MIKNENYVVIQGFMINELHLKGNELVIYAIIYGFTQEQNKQFDGSLSYLMAWTNSTKQGVIKARNSLIDKGLIVRIGNGFATSGKLSLPRQVNKVDPQGKQSLPPSQLSLPPRSTKFTSTGKQSLPNNIEDKLDDNLVDKLEKGARATFVKPTLKEARE